jgi:hypothetical protein
MLLFENVESQQKEWRQHLNFRVQEEYEPRCTDHPMRVRDLTKLNREGVRSVQPRPDVHFPGAGSAEHRTLHEARLPGGVRARGSGAVEKVIIRGDRIMYAACIFPLTQRQDLNKSLGTRHRAAIGLSEETDATIVVVSEETGAISYAYKGHLVRGVSAEELRAFLTSVFGRVAKTRGWVGRLRAWSPQRVSPAAPTVTKAASK